MAGQTVAAVASARTAIQDTSANASDIVQDQDEADSPAGEAEAKLIIARDIMPILGNLVIADLRWRSDPVASCAAANREESAIDVVEQNIEALRLRLVAENGEAGAVQETFGDMPNLRSITEKAKAHFCDKSAEQLTPDDRAVFDKATSMAEVFFARFAGAAKAAAQDDSEVSCQNLRLARTNGSDLQSYLLVESQNSEAVARELSSDGVMKFFSLTIGLVEEGISNCDE